MPGAEQGQIIVETLLLLMVLLTLVFAFVEVCLMGIQKHEFDRIARYGARCWAVRHSWNAQQGFHEAAALRNQNAAGAFYSIQESIGSAEESTEGSRSGILTRSYIPFLMPFVEDFAGWAVSSPPDPPTGYDSSQLSNRGVKKVVRARAFIPMDKEASEDPDKYDNDYNDD